jgi:hypothetical protein
MLADISYDLVMEADMEFAEGTFLLPGSEWQVFVFARGDVAKPGIKSGRWESGATGIFVEFPRESRLNQVVVEQVLSAALGVGEFRVVQGPDSMQLR